MKKFFKWLIIFGNVGIFYIALKWWTPQNWQEPLIVIIGQVVSFFTLLSDQAPSVFSKGIKNNSKVKLRVTPNTNLHTEDIDNSELEIDNK
jgi:hypothetical protein